MRVYRAVCVAVLVTAIIPAEAHAYLDPGTGSQLFQVLLALFVGAAFTVKVYWKRIIDYFRTLTGGSDE
ncbi:MAG: hypothetical protein R6U70_04035 [Bacillota bacterium]